MNPFILYGQSSISKNSEEESLSLETSQTSYQKDIFWNPLVLKYQTTVPVVYLLFSQTHPHGLKFCSKLMEMVSSEFYFSGSLDSWLPLNFGNRRHWLKISRKKRGKFMLLVPAVWQFPGNDHNISWAKVTHCRLRKEPFPFTAVPALTEVTFLCWNQDWL